MSAYPQRLGSFRHRFSHPPRAVHDAQHRPGWSLQYTRAAFKPHWISPMSASHVSDLDTGLKSRSLARARRLRPRIQARPDAPAPGVLFPRARAMSCSRERGREPPPPFFPPSERVPPPVLKPGLSPARRVGGISCGARPRPARSVCRSAGRAWRRADRRTG